MREILLGFGLVIVIVAGWELPGLNYAMLWVGMLCIVLGVRS